MSEFLESFAGELQRRDKFLQDHADSAASDASGEFAKELAGLQEMQSAISRRVSALEGGDASEWEVSKESLHRDLEALDKEIHTRICMRG